MNICIKYKPIKINTRHNVAITKIISVTINIVMEYDHLLSNAVNKEPRLLSSLRFGKHVFVTTKSLTWISMDTR
jgi:hypothetical protein